MTPKIEYEVLLKSVYTQTNSRKLHNSQKINKEGVIENYRINNKIDKKLPFGDADDQPVYKNIITQNCTRFKNIEDLIKKLPFLKRQKFHQMIDTNQITENRNKTVSVQITSIFRHSLNKAQDNSGNNNKINIAILRIIIIS